MHENAADHILLRRQIRHEAAHPRHFGRRRQARRRGTLRDCTRINRLPGHGLCRGHSAGGNHCRANGGKGLRVPRGRGRRADALCPDHWRFGCSDRRVLHRHARCHHRQEDRQHAGGMGLRGRRRELGRSARGRRRHYDRHQRLGSVGVPVRYAGRASHCHAHSGFGNRTRESVHPERYEFHAHQHLQSGHAGHAAGPGAKVVPDRAGRRVRLCAARIPDHGRGCAGAL